ncbi:hypothetical protein [Flavobacterium reichenbachii]|uniref:Uncharacterized protein n=1 Tax=Flavobacterium reichenbachii TaxID=362418 RepID=A0A085ZIF1_9FLAO|nr:hypothetical protein [Flavobacterium reichenbachii]KFF04215.1 hypothetical protein IW19_01160 [Flavobacterium reichenbachii]OXB13885.1 hypothetical protein B0A68_14145 [Flavobacterium reichenbachii]
MKYTAIVLFIFLTSFIPTETMVFICGSGGAKKYHLKDNCRGLSSCKQEIVQTSITKAKNSGLTICGWED